MMDRYAFPFLWCVVQVSVVSAIALIAAAIPLRHRPEAATKIICAASLVALVMTLFIPISLPRQWARQAASVLRMFAAKPLPVPLPNKPTRAAGEAAPNVADPEMGIQFNPALLLKKLAELKTPATQSVHSLAMYIEAALVLGFTWGISNLLAGLFLLNSFRRRAMPIRDPLFIAFVDELRQEMNCRHPVFMSESCEIGTAAVVGLFHPTIVLSTAWRHWDSQVRRSVIAHELAHVRNRDVLWRLIATFGELVHFYNPLLRWLGRRLVLAQELAADRLAFPKSGGASVYLRSLSQLALEEDARPRVRSHLSVTPVFSGHLLRRIEMLRAMDCKHNTPAKTWSTWAAIAAIACFGLATTALRSFAEGAKEQKPSTKRADTKGVQLGIPGTINVLEGTGILLDNGTGIILNGGPNDDLEGNGNGISINADNKIGVLVRGSDGIHVTHLPNLFRREKVPATHPAFTKHGAFHVNCAAARQTVLWPVIKSNLSGEEAQSTWLKHCDWNGLDSLISNFILTVKPKTKTERGRVMFGAGYVRVNTNHDVDWHRAIHEVAKEPVDGTKDGVNYTDAQISALGPSKVRFVAVSPRELATLVSVRHDEKDPTKMLPVELNLAQWLNPKSEDLQHPWADEWDAAGGGIVTGLLKVPEMKDFFASDAEAENKDAMEIVETLRKVEVVSFGIDMQDRAFGVNLISTNLVHVKVRLQCVESADPVVMLKSVQKYIDLGKQTNWNADDPNRSPADDIFSKLLADAYSKTSLKVIHGPKNVIECATTFEISPEFLASVAADSNDKKVTPTSNETSK